jgi:hypothetical protein
MPVTEFRRRGGDAGGPEDPLLEERVERLEKILASLEPKISEILLTCAKRDDVLKLQLEIAEVKGRIQGIDGRLAGIDGRFSQIPTTWQILALVGTLLVGLSGLIFTASRFLHP